MKIKYKLPKGVTLEILDNDAHRRDRQDSAFYTWGYGGSKVATLTYREKEYTIYCCGEMRIHYKDQVIRYCDDLISAGFSNDKKLATLEREGGEWINNSWFEVYDEFGQEYTGAVYHTVKDAIESTAEEIAKEGGECDNCATTYDPGDTLEVCAECHKPWANRSRKVSA